MAIFVLAPMRELTGEFFMELLSEYGVPDYFMTEFFRVTPHVHFQEKDFEPYRSICTKHKVVLQLLGEDRNALVRVCQEALEFPFAGIDFNVGCPVRRICRKQVGGGLLRDLPQLESLLDVLCANVPQGLSIKTRLGYEHKEEIYNLIELLKKFPLRGVALHGRTVKALYTGEVEYDLIAEAVRSLSYPVLANGDLFTFDKVQEVLSWTKAAGVMIGRGALANPWIFSRLRQGEVLDEVTEKKLTATYVLKLRDRICQNISCNVLGVLKRYFFYLTFNQQVTEDFIRQLLYARSVDEFNEHLDRFVDGFTSS